VNGAACATPLVAREERRVPTHADTPVPAPSSTHASSDSTGVVVVDAIGTGVLESVIGLVLDLLI